MGDTEKARLPRWPLLLALSLLTVVEILFVVLLSTEGAVENMPMIVNSVAIVIFCVLTWRGLPWGRWLVIAMLTWRVVGIGISAASHLGPDDHRLGGSLLLVAFYVVAGSVVASPLGRVRRRAAA
jgi:hypothetical protein